MPQNVTPTSFSSGIRKGWVSHTGSLIVVGILILLGIGFRVSHLSEPVFWVDEVATVTRVSGYTRAEIVADLADGEGRSPQDLQRYQQVSGDRSWGDTLHALRGSPEHAPLYFLGARLWMQLFGSSVVALRSFSVVLGLLLLPALYGFCRVLFPYPPVALWTVGLAAVSPYLIAYAKEARPYSLWALVLVAGSGMLAWAWRRQSWRAWVGYAASVALMLYTSLLSAPVLVGQGLYVSILSRGRFTPPFGRFLVALGLGILAFAPWVAVMVQQWGLLEDNTAWARSPLSLPIMVAVWLYSFAILIFDVPIAPFPSLLGALQGVMAAIVLGIMGWAVWALLRRTAFAQWGLLLALALPTPLVLILLDGLRGGQVSATSRYLFPTQIALIVVLGWFLAQHLEQHPRSARGLLAGLLVLCLLSDGLGLGRSPNYQKARNIHNPAIAEVLNTAPSPLLIVPTDQAFDALSLSHSLNDSVTLRFFPSEALASAIPQPLAGESVFLLNPGQVARDRLTQTLPIQLREAYEPELLTDDDIYLALWQVVDR